MGDVKDVVLVDYLRAPISRSRPREPEKDLFNCWRMDQVFAKLIKEVIKRNVSNSFLFGKLDSVFSHKLEVGESLPTEAFTITKEDLPEVIKMERKFTEDFSAILDDMFKIEEL